MNDNSLAEIGQPKRLTIKRYKHAPWWRDRTSIFLVAGLLGMILVLLFICWPKPQEVVALPSTFVVHPGDSLIKTYGFDDGINVAERLRVPLRMREIGSDMLIPITYDQARALKSATDRNLVTALLFPGDRILTMRYPNGRVDMEEGVLFVPAPLASQAADR